MKILYVTSAWTGLKDVVFNGSIEARGMPAFIKPLRELISRGYNVDLFLIHDLEVYPEYNIAIEWLKEEQFVGNIYWESSLVKKPLNIIRLRSKVKEVMQKKKYDFVYGQGYSCEPARKVAQSMGVPFGQRLYGTFLYAYILKNDKIKASIIRNLEYKTFKSPKDFLLVTNDGSKGDKAYAAINKGEKPSDFYFWHNGLDKMEDIPTKQLDNKFKKLGGEEFLFYVARIDKWKRQDRAINILKLLKDNGHDMKLYIAGQVFNEGYYKELKEQIIKMKLTNNVVFMGTIDRDTINVMSKLAVASFSLYDMCNLGNVFYEMLSAGAVIVSCDDGSLDDFIEHEKNGFLINSDEEAAENIIEVINNNEYEKAIRKNAIMTVTEKMRSWEERVDDEIKLIESFLNRNYRNNK